jgi:transposase
LELSLESVDDETREEIGNLEGQWTFYYEQVRIVINLMRGKSWSLKKIGAIFDMSKGSMNKVYARSLTPRLQTGRPSALTAEQMEFVKMTIYSGFGRREPVTYPEIMNQLELEYGVSVLPDTLRHVIHRMPWCKTIEGVPQEAPRVFCDEADIDGYYEYLERTLDVVPSAVIYNVDETGFDAWVGASRLRVVVPVDLEESAIPIPVTRKDKRASCIACNVANGCALKPVIVIPRKTIEIDLYECGFTPDTCHVVFQEHGFLTGELFAEWAEAVFFSGYDSDLPISRLCRADLSYPRWFCRSPL